MVNTLSQDLLRKVIYIQAGHIRIEMGAKRETVTSSTNNIYRIFFFFINTDMVVYHQNWSFGITRLKKCSIFFIIIIFYYLIFAVTFSKKKKKKQRYNE